MASACLFKGKLGDFLTGAVSWAGACWGVATLTKRFKIASIYPE